MGKMVKVSISLRHRRQCKVIDEKCRGDFNRPHYEDMTKKEHRKKGEVNDRKIL